MRQQQTRSYQGQKGKHACLCFPATGRHFDGVGTAQHTTHQNNTCDHPCLFPKPTPLVGRSDPSWPGLAACWLEQRWGGEGGVQAEVWKERPATSSLSQPIEQESKSPSEFLSGAHPAAAAAGAPRLQGGGRGAPTLQDRRSLSGMVAKRGHYCQLGFPCLPVEPQRG